MGWETDTAKRTDTVMALKWVRYKTVGRLKKSKRYSEPASFSVWRNKLQAAQSWFCCCFSGLHNHSLERKHSSTTAEIKWIH